ncbi:hypothetical protein P153DRAFT_97033 [Dothidotthia symphoricarpi CBS 119687]|uniref:Uncharacterized protein n=1 Tax=Dothidotthia symphoricarpi CBS 119687 TaxID=1392245 RepID=A0A6A6AR95_9PLEO|nr:uncharacterized protein P153DRAFT_97033 [Dothidotthia symphoricarpi CBS 119687]KAF2133698.1 hypothetical protein P153DRAFT_97033 [Dothidotthia symphoricarpi CBS 119687]
MDAIQEQHREIGDILRKEIEVLKKHAIENEHLRQQQIDSLKQSLKDQEDTHRIATDNLRREFDEKKKLLEEDTEDWKQFGAWQKKAWLQVTGGNYLKRVTERWPVELELHGLRGDWEQIWNDFCVMSSTALRKTGFRTDPVPDTLTPFGSLLHRMCGLPMSGETQPLKVSQCFQGVSSVPSDHRIIEGLMIADILEWCFTTSFHTKGMGSQKLDQLWESIAHYGRSR